MMRAKFQLSNIEQYPTTGDVTQETLTFHAVTYSRFDENGVDEDNTYSQYTPSADLRMSITNPALIGKFMVGDKFYVDFTKVE